MLAVARRFDPDMAKESVEIRSGAAVESTLG
jgi:hypothetical protein